MPVIVSAKTTATVNSRKPLIGMKNEAIKPQQREKAMNS
jgi:hypothetical protein